MAPENTEHFTNDEGIEATDEFVADLTEDEKRREYRRVSMTYKALYAEVQELAMKGIALKKKRDEAKTKPKRDLYAKKMRKNSEAAVQLLPTLEMYTAKLRYLQNVMSQEFVDEGTNDE